jgi:hypothetical protein
MTVATTTSALADAVLSFGLPAELIRQRVAGIHQKVLAHSRYIRDANFTAIHTWDLEFLFKAYDDGFFAGLGQRALEGTRIQFRLAPRLTRAGGKTTRFTKPSGEVSYEIAIASSMLFDGFGKMDRRISVCGLECQNRLEGLQRIFEHELVHLVEQVVLANKQLRGGTFPGHREEALSASSSHARAHHTPGTGGRLGDPARLIRDFRIRRKTVDGSRKPDHKTRHRPRRGCRGAKVLRWLAVQNLLRADRVPGARAGGVRLSRVKS